MQRKIIFNFFNDEISTPLLVVEAQATAPITPKVSLPFLSSFFPAHVFHSLFLQKAKSSPLNMITPKLSGYRVECSVGRSRNETHWRSKIEIERMEKLENYYAIYFLGKSMSPPFFSIYLVSPSHSPVLLFTSYIY